MRSLLSSPVREYRTPGSARGPSGNRRSCLNGVKIMKRTIVCLFAFTATCWAQEPAAPKAQMGDVLPTAEQRIEELESRVVRLEVQVGILQGKIIVKDGRYQIRAGDTGLKIARMFDVSIPDLAALNPDISWAKLKIGQFIRIEADRSPNQQPPLQTPASIKPTAGAPVAPPPGAAGR